MFFPAGTGESMRAIIRMGWSLVDALIATLLNQTGILWFIFGAVGVTMIGHMFQMLFGRGRGVPTGVEAFGVPSASEVRSARQEWLRLEERASRPVRRR